MQGCRSEGDFEREGNLESRAYVVRNFCHLLANGLRGEELGEIGTTLAGVLRFILLDLMTSD